MTNLIARVTKTIEDWEEQADERDPRDPMKSRIYREAADLRAVVAQLADAQAALKAKMSSPDLYEDTAHFDDHAVNRFAAVMKGKLAAKRMQGRGGWQEPQVPNGYLSRLLREHVDKGDPVDVANFAMMIHQRGERIAAQNEGASCKAIDDAEADRDALAAKLAAAEARVGSLMEAVREARDAAHSMAHDQYDGVWNEQDFREYTPLSDAALTTPAEEMKG